MTAQERADRNAAIFEARARGFSWRRIARDFHISERQAQRLFKEQRHNHSSVTALDPVAVAEELLANFDAAVDELAALALETSHAGVKLGAIRARVNVLDSKVQLLQALGVLPEDLANLRLVVDARALSDALLRVLDRHEALSEPLLTDLLEQLGGAPPELSANGRRSTGAIALGHG